MQSLVLQGEEMEKKVVLLISSPPFVTLNNYEALRASISLIDHRVAIIWKDEGVHFTLKSVNKATTKNLLRLAEDLEIDLYVSKGDLMKRSLDHLELEGMIKKIDQECLLNTLRDADVVLTF